MTGINHPLFTPLPWDSEHFGFSVARITRLHNPIAELPVVLATLCEHQVRLAYWEAPAGDAICRETAEKHGGKLINSRLEFRILLDEARACSTPRILTSPNEEQRAALHNLALASGWSSRFALDPNFPHLEFKRLYHTWMENSLSGEIADAILFKGKQDSIDAMVTVSVKGNHGNIGLFCVAETERGKGIGKELLHDGLSWFAGQGCRTVSVVTQGENLGATALYKSCGFTINEQLDVYHFWNPEL